MTAFFISGNCSRICFRQIKVRMISPHTHLALPPSHLVLHFTNPLRGGGGLPNPITAEGFADSPLPQKGVFSKLNVKITARGASASSNPQRGPLMKHPAQCLSNEFVDQMALSEWGRVEVEARSGEEMVEFIDFICAAGRGKTLPVYLRSLPQGALRFL